MRNLKKIKLSNIDNSKLEKEQLIKMTGGVNPCYECSNCVGARIAVNNSISKYTSSAEFQQK